MRIIIIGGNGTIGKSIVKQLSDHEVIIAGRSSGNVLVDIADSSSIEKMFNETGKVDAVVCAAGTAKWAPFSEMTEQDFYIGIGSKLMGQVNLTRLSTQFLNANGSITLTTGILADDPVRMTTSAAMVNGGIHSFVKAAALELNNGIRINAVAVGVVEDAFEKFHNLFPGYPPISMQRVAWAYERAILGAETGKVVRVYE